MPNRSDYEALPQTEEEDHDYEEGDSLLPTLVQGESRGLRRANRPGSIDIRKLDNAFKRCVASAYLSTAGSHARRCIWSLIYIN